MDQTGGGAEPNATATNIIISDRVLINESLKTLTFHSDGRLIWSETEGSNEQCLLFDKDVLGVTTEGSTINIRYVTESRDGGILCFLDQGSLVRKNFDFEPCSYESRKMWFQKLQEYLGSLGRPKRLFVFVNPFGGKKSASKIFKDVVKPLLDDAEIQFTLQETQHQLHAKEIAYSLDLTKYDGLVCVSGDGILVEVVNGLLQREDWQTAIKMPLGVVPAGTGNGMAKSLLDSVGDPCTAFNAVLAIIRGHKQPLDVATISQGKIRFFSVLMLAWGLVADIDIESEKYRWMGSARLDFYAIQRIACLRRYQGHIYFVPAPGSEDQAEQISQKLRSIHDLPSCNATEEQKATEKSYQGPKLDMENVNWRSIEGPFVSIWLHNVPWGSQDAMPAPNAKFSDGYLDLVLIKDCPRLGLLSLMTELNNGNHIKSPYVFYLKVKAFILEPGQRTEDSTKGGIIDSDGEVLARGSGTYMCERKSLMAYDKLQIIIDRGLATLFSPL